MITPMTATMAPGWQGSHGEAENGVTPPSCPFFPLKADILQRGGTSASANSTHSPDAIS
jgi:hypothetical protein